MEDNKNDLGVTPNDPEISETVNQPTDEDFLENVKRSKEPIVEQVSDTEKIVVPEVIVNNEGTDPIKKDDVTVNEIFEDNSGPKPIENPPVEEVKVESPKNTVVNISTKEAIERKEERSKNSVSKDSDIETLLGNEIKETAKYVLDDSEKEKSLSVDETVQDFIDNQYEDDDIDSEDRPEVQLTKRKKDTETSADQTEEELKTYGYKKQNITFYGGDGKVTSFKQKISSTARAVKDIVIDDTTEIEAEDMNKMSYKEQNDVFIQSFVPIFNPVYVVVPLVTSGIVIQMSAFKWSDILDICKISEEQDDLYTNDDDYIYDRNQIYLKKRRRQIEMFYSHIFSISGYDKVPSLEEFCRVVKYPDFQQLFFAAYASSFVNKNDYEIQCDSCGHKNDISITPKELCFYLNKHVNIDQINSMLTRGIVSKRDPSDTYLDELRDYKVVKACSKIYRSKKKLPNTAIIPEYKIPNLTEYLDGMSAIIESFRDKSILNIDNSYNQEPDEIVLRLYLYIQSLMIPSIDKTKFTEKDGKKVYDAFYTTVTDKSSIMDYIKQLSIEDYNELIKNENLRILQSFQGIRHAIDAKKCGDCGADIDKIWVDPEELFFMTARPLLTNI